MSNRPCNLCELRRLRERAEKAGMSVVLENHPLDGFDKGVDVMVNGEFTAWYAEVPERCSC